MADFLQNQILFYAALVFVMFLPGYFLLLAIFGKRKILGSLERFIFSFGLSIIGVDFIFFAYSGLKISITRLSIIAGVVIFSLICAIIYRLKISEGDSNHAGAEEKLFNFSHSQLILILLILFLTLFIKVAYLSETISPSSTDMGHHMYWSKWMVENHKLPDYESMPDFIIGEQTMFGAIALVSGLSFFTAFPPLVLLLVDILGILTVFVLTLRIFKEKNIAIFALFFLGVLYAISAPQTKFVSGGVVGNIIGNFFMPLAFYFYYRAFEFIAEPDYAPTKESKIFLSLAVFTTFGLFYTHHLTAFIFMFVFAFLILLFFAMNYKNTKDIFFKAWKIIFSPPVLLVFVFGLIFFFFIFTPNYVNSSAIDTAVGAPSKATRFGLSVSDLTSAIGTARFSLGFFGLLLLFLSKNRQSFGYLALAAWAVMLFLISTEPHLLFINLPSDRIGNYLSYPLSILGAYGLYWSFKSEWVARNNLFKIAFFVILGFALIEGISDSAMSIPKQNDYADLVQTFRASVYLTTQASASDGIIKDHNYIAGDSWIKLFFMRGYKYPLSRGYFKRYDDTTKPREMCTLNMISNPGGDAAMQCFSDTGTNFVMVNPKFDSGQFRKLGNFNQVYLSPDIAVYYKVD